MSGFERHEYDDAACIGQWCCGCAEHPVGKPWGWNYQAWAEHYATCPSRGGVPLEKRLSAVERTQE